MQLLFVVDGRRGCSCCCMLSRESDERVKGKKRGKEKAEAMSVEEDRTRSKKKSESVSKVELLDEQGWLYPRACHETRRVNERSGHCGMEYVCLLCCC